jgi:TonB-linked SusC/RagA family outer membrane protein
MQSIGGVAKTELGILSYFARVNYAYKNRYLFEANVRADGSSRFAPGHRWGTFPSASAGWRISEEGFFEPLRDVVDNMRLRVSYGILGNQVSGLYDWQAIYGKVNNVFNQQVADGVIPTQQPNFQLSWEKTATANYGIDFHMFKQRLGVEFDYYTRHTTDMLIRPPAYLTVGNITQPMVNAAAMKNHCLDFSINWNDKRGDFGYSVGFNAGWNTNVITEYRGELMWAQDPNVLDVWGNPTWRYVNLADATTGGNQRIAEGRVANEWYLHRPYSGTGTYFLSDGSVDPNGGPHDGMIRTKADLDWIKAMWEAGYRFNGSNANNISPNGAGNIWYGTLIMADTNGDGRYGDANDAEFTGKSSIPKWVFGLNLSFDYKGFDLSTNWSGRLGSYHYIIDRGMNSSTFSNAGDTFPADALIRYYSYDAVAAFANNGVNDYDPALDPNANHLGRYPRLLSASGSTPANTKYLYNTSFLKLKSMQVGYTLPRKWLNQDKISTVRVFVTGENLLSIFDKNFPAVDPELDGAGIVYPIARMISGGVSITF